MPAELLPLFYAFNSPTGGEFWMCLWGTYGKPAMLFLPRLDLVVHDFLSHDALSTPAAPLLDAVKDRKTKDAVRSVIERFTTAPKALQPDAEKKDEAPAAAAPAEPEKAN